MFRGNLDADSVEVVEHVVLNGDRQTQLTMAVLNVCDQAIAPQITPVSDPGQYHETATR